MSSDTRRVLIVGPGSRFTSGISYYTASLANALADHADVDCLLFGDLAPRIIYPGAARVGTRSLDELGFRDEVGTAEHLHWYWGTGILKALRVVSSRRDAMVLQWWTATALHTYLLLALAARRAGTPVVIEFHETVDVSEARIAPVRWYARFGMRLLARLAAHGVVHSRADAARVPAELPLGSLPLTVIHHGPYRTVTTAGQGVSAQTAADQDVPSLTVSSSTVFGPGGDLSTGSGTPVRLLFFGVLRAYKGLGTLADALEILNQPGRPPRFHLSVHGEPWEDADADLVKLRALDPASVSFDLKYLDNHEVAAAFSRADIVVLPYLRSAASGPLHMAMGEGKVVVTSDIAALAEVVDGYSGAVLAAPGDAADLARAITTSTALTGSTHTDPHSWGRVAQRFLQVLDTLAPRTTPVAGSRSDRAPVTGDPRRASTTGPLRVAMITPRFAPYPGGVEHHTAALSAALAELGHELRVFTLTASAAPRPTGEPFTVHTFAPRVGDLAPTVPAAAVVEAVTAFAPDVIHLHQYHQPLAALVVARLRSALPHTRIVFTPHYHGEGRNALTTLAHRAWGPTFGKALFATVDEVVAVSAPEQALLLRDFPFLAGRCTVIPNGTETPPSGQLPEVTLPAGFAASAPVVLVSGRLERYKRVDLVIEASRHRPWTLVVTGDGPERSRLERLAGGNVVFVGHLPAAELHAWRRRASVTVAASTQEAFGMSFAEARAAGHVVVASGIPAHRYVAGLAGGATLISGDVPRVWGDAIASALETSPPPAALPSWRDVATELLERYHR